MYLHMVLIDYRRQIHISEWKYKFPKSVVLRYTIYIFFRTGSISVAIKYSIYHKDRGDIKYVNSIVGHSLTTF